MKAVFIIASLTATMTIVAQNNNATRSIDSTIAINEKNIDVMFVISKTHKHVEISHPPLHNRGKGDMFYVAKLDANRAPVKFQKLWVFNGKDTAQANSYFFHKNRLVKIAMDDSWSDTLNFYHIYLKDGNVIATINHEGKTFDAYSFLVNERSMIKMMKRIARAFPDWTSARKRSR